MENKRLKIATHNSVTGEKSFWLSWLLIPFARTQTKTIFHQYAAGCRMFDLRTKHVFGKWRGAHGWWFSNVGIEDVLKTLNVLSTTFDPIEVHLTYEGKAKNAGEFEEIAKKWKEEYNRLIWGPISAKYSDNSLKVNYKILIPADKNAQSAVQAFLPLDGKHWQTFFPVPWFWKQFYFKHVTFNTEQFQFVDFL